MPYLSLSSISKTKLTQLKRSACRPQMYLSLEGSQYDPNARATVYEIEVGILSGCKVFFQTRFVRFSALARLDGLLRSAIGAAALPAFPPKRLFGNLSRQFIMERSLKLQKYLSGLPDTPSLLKQEPFLTCFALQVNDLAN
jgi:hypothetical protein